MLRFTSISSSLLIVFYCITFIEQCACTADQPDITYPALYQWGKEAYTNERWYECVAFMKRALEDYQYYNSVILHCHKKCRRLVHVNPFILNDQQIERKSVLEIKFYEKLIQNSLCLSRCADERFAERPTRDPANKAKVDDEFDKMLPYSYMQICYWKMDDLPHAVSAAYTYIVRNPNDTMMINNLNFYQNQHGFSTKMLKNLNELEHEGLYERALDHYDDEDYENAIINFELTLDSYFKLLDQCYSLCIKTRPSEWNEDWTIDVYSVITIHLHNLLACRSRCVRKLNTVKSITLQNFVPQIFNHLQFAYWKANKLRKACEAVATFLLFSPDDKTMLENKKFYLLQGKVTEEHFVPRPNVLTYFEQYVLDLKLVAFIDDRFKRREGNNEFTAEHPDDSSELSLDVDADFIKLWTRYEKLETYAPMDVDDSGSSKTGSKGGKDDSSSNSETEKSYQGTTALTEDLSQLGSGYAGKGSPHTKHENFHGLTIGKLVDLTAESKVPLHIAKLFYDKTELARNFVEKYFNLTSNLYVDYTHFACRSTKSGGSGNKRNDLSHPIHGDNCMFKDGRCDKRFPAFTWRDFSAVIYLNDNFDGGEFIFADSDENEAASLKPSCGQMVSFIGSALHGVKAVTKGTRCALALWMTLDPAHQELERLDAEKRLSSLSKTAQNRVILDVKV